MFVLSVASLTPFLWSGVGVSDDKIGSMFEAFAQVQEGQITGTGLGLFGVRTRAEGLLGTCGARHNVESLTGTGTVLWFTVPYTPDNSCASPGATRGVAYKRTVAASKAQSERWTEHSGGLEADDPSPSPAEELKLEGLIKERKLTAIVIDDTKTVQKLMEKLLLKMGFARVSCYSNGAKGLEAMMCGCVDIVFSDVQMPIMTGPEVITLSL